MVITQALSQIPYNLKQTQNKNKPTYYMINLPLVEHCPTPMAVLNKNKELLLTSISWDVLFKHPILVNSDEIHFSKILPPSLEQTRRALLNHSPGQHLKGEDSYVDQQRCLKWIAYQISATPDQSILKIRDRSHQKEVQHHQSTRRARDKDPPTGAWHYDVENDVLQWWPTTQAIVVVGEDYAPSLRDSVRFW